MSSNHCEGLYFTAYHMISLLESQHPVNLNFIQSPRDMDEKEEVQKLHHYLRNYPRRHVNN